MRLWIDADACPASVREIVVRAAERCRVEATFVANGPVRVPRSDYVRTLQVGSRFDEADETIVTSVEPGDLVVTADIPLAARIVEKGACGLNPRGTLYTGETIGEHLARREQLEEMRAYGMPGTGPSPMSKTDVRDFANRLDSYLARHARKEKNA